MCTENLLCSLRKRSSELIVYMSIATMGENLTVLSLLQASREGNSAACTAFGFFSIFFSIAGAIWATIIAHTLSLVLLERNKLMTQLKPSDGNKDMRRLRVLRFHSLSWGIAFLFAIIPATTGYFAVVNDWCWYDGDIGGSGTDKNLMEIFTYIAPLGVAVVYCLGVFCFVMWNMQAIKESALRTKDPLNLQLYELTYTLKFYPVVLMVTEGYNVALRIVTWINLDADMFYYFLVLVILLQSQGTMYFIAYFLRSAVRKMWFDLIFGAKRSDSYATLLCCLTPSSDRDASEHSFLGRLPDLLHLENASTMSHSSQVVSRVNSQDGDLGDRQISSTLRTYQRSISGEKSTDGSLQSFIINPISMPPACAPVQASGSLSATSGSRISLNMDSGDDMEESG